MREHHERASDSHPAIRKVLRGLLIRREPVHKMVDFLWWVETEHMGLAGSHRKTEKVAERLLRLPDELALRDAEPGTAADRGDG